MSHEIETMAWTGQVPWHGLGVEVGDCLSPHEMLVAAGLDWTVEKRPMYADVGAEYGVAVPGFWALTRSSDNKVLDVMRSRWRPLQNADAMEFFTAFCAAGGARMETAGSLRGGRVMWGLAKLPAGFEVAPGDRVEGYLLLVNPHQCGFSVEAKVTTTRVVCANTMAVAMRDQSRFSARFSHSRDFDPVEATEAIGIASERIVDFARTAQQLKGLSLSEIEVLQILAPVYSPNSVDEVLEIGLSAASPSLVSVMESYKQAPGADVGTGWGVLNAVTYHADHRAGKDGDDARLTSAWLGTEARRKDQVLAALVAVC